MFFQSPKHRRPYSRVEEIEILKYIIEHKAYHCLRGIAIWKKMEAACIGNYRTYQSMKEHFRKYMIHRLNEKFYCVIDEEDLREIREGYQDSAADRAVQGCDLSKTPPMPESDTDED